MHEDTQVPSKENEITRVLRNLALVTEDCEKSLEEFKVRLSSVCNKEGEDSEKSAEREYSTLLAQEINKIVSRVQRLGKQMNYLRNRIEL